MAVPPGEPTDEPAPAAAAANGNMHSPRVPESEDEDRAVRSTSAPSRHINTSPRAAKRSPASHALSPRSSRETSPVRPTPAATATAAAAKPRARSRKNSEELSPHRSAAANNPLIRDVPSAAAVQRALSATGTPRLTPDGSTDGLRPRSQRPAATGTAAAPAANTSRVKSPPRAKPSSRTPSAARRNEPAAASQPPPPSLTVEEVVTPREENADHARDSDGASDGGVRSPSRPSFGGSTLAAVQESSLPETPAIGSVTSPPAGTPRSGSREPPPLEALDNTPKAHVLSTESESETGSSLKPSPVEAIDEASKPGVAAAASTLQPKKSLSQMSTSSAKGKGGDGSVRNMTVETVTVNQLPQLAVSSTGTERSGNRSETGGTLRVKPSTETIRPKKDKKKTARKATPAGGAPSTKADIFEAKVASAVDEADSSDSGETFVYESNPPEPPSRGGGRFHHSRTPSAQSMASAAAAAARLADGHNSILGKKSMKFTNSLHNLSDAGDADASLASSGAPGPGGGGGGGGGAANGHHHRAAPHHIGRHGRPAGHVSILGSEAPFVATPTRMRHGHGHGSRSTTPREAGFRGHGPGSGKLMAYELDEENGADDERTPLMHPHRTSHHRHSRRPTRTRSAGRPGGGGGPVARGPWGWVVLGSLGAILVAAVVFALVLCSKPLTQVRIGAISNVIASEEEVVFDLQMFAVNANLVAVQVDQLDMKVFAKSKYVGSTARHAAAAGDVRPADNVDEGTDPFDPDDPEQGADTMMLAHVYRLDSPLRFEPSPFAHRRVSDLGELSIDHPGNRTADDGSDRWKSVVQHPFDLIVVGQLMYSLPTSSKLRKVSVGRGRVTVQPRAPEPPTNGNGTNGTAGPLMPGPVRQSLFRWPWRRAEAADAPRKGPAIALRFDA